MTRLGDAMTPLRPLTALEQACYVTLTGTLSGLTSRDLATLERCSLDRAYAALRTLERRRLVECFTWRSAAPGVSRGWVWRVRPEPTP